MENQMDDQILSGPTQFKGCPITPINVQNDHQIVQSYNFCKDCEVFGTPLIMANYENGTVLSGQLCHTKSYGKNGCETICNL